jgi:hypothetical protein
MVRFSILFFRDYDTVGDLSSASAFGMKVGAGYVPTPGRSPIVNRNLIESFVNVPHTPSSQ